MARQFSRVSQDDVNPPHTCCASVSSVRPGVDGFTNRRQFRSFLSDMDAMAVCYAIDNKRKPSMGNRFMVFNLLEFAETMDAVLTRLNQYLGWIDAEVDERMDQLREY